MKVPTIESYIELYPYEGNRINLYNRASGKTYLIGEKEAKVLMLLDGNHSFNEIENECPFYTSEELQKLVKAFSDLGIFAKEKSRNIFKLKKRLFNPNKIFNPKGESTKLLFNLIMIGCPVMLIMGLAFNILMLNRSVDSGLQITGIIDAYMNFDVPDVIALYIGFTFCLMLHELSHTIAARYYGVNVPEIGIMLYFFIPCAYTNISGINLLKGKKERLIILASGNFANLGLIGILYALLNVVGVHGAALLLGLIILNAGTIFMNGMIFLKFDGYYMLEVILDETQLREKASQHLKQYVSLMFNKDKNALRGFYDNVRHDYSKYLTHVGYITFSLLSSAYIPLVIVNTAISIISLA